MEEGCGNMFHSGLIKILEDASKSRAVAFFGANLLK